MKKILAMTALQRDELKRHLFSGDGKESVAIALCGGRRSDIRERITVYKIILVPNEVCAERTSSKITWPAHDMLMPILEEAERKRLSIVKFHSHPTGFNQFSGIDDNADEELFTSIHNWLETDVSHISVLMLPNGKMKGRSVAADGSFDDIHCISVVGDDLEFYWSSAPEESVSPESAKKNIQAFGEGTHKTLSKLRIGIVGCSGTGSVVFEMLKRLHVGELVIVDADRVEKKNLNRILQAHNSHSLEKTPKVALLQNNAKETALGTLVFPYENDLMSRAAVKALAECDIVFGCMDSIYGRHLLNCLATFYTLPYLDVGVRLESDGKGGISQICGSVHYLQPGLSTLMSRNLYTAEQLRAEVLKIESPEQYKSLLKEKYITGVSEERPAVVSVNFVFAANAVNDLLARIHNYRTEPNSHYAIETVSISNGETFRTSENECEKDPMWIRYVGRGDLEPLLNQTQLSLEEKTE